MAYGVMVPVAIAATNIDAWNRSCIGAVDFENGGLCGLLTKSSTAGQLEVWDATAPATSDLMSDWIVYDPELVWTGSYRGLNPDPRDYIITAGRVFSAFRPWPHDLILMSEDCFTAAKSTNTYANATNGQKQLVWGGSQSSSCVAFKYIATQYISIGTGAIADQRITAYLMECLVQT